MTELALFASTFASVFCLGFQSQNVNRGHYGWAAVTSLAISASTLWLYRLLPSAGVSEVAAYMAGGPLGIVASMVVHRRYLRKDAA